MSPLKSLIISVVFIFVISQSFSQNIVITDDDTYTANSSAMLDVKSTSKGLLIPRLTTAQRTALGTIAATGLLVFDTNLNSFYYWNGTTWTNLTSGSASGIWSYNSPNVYLTNTNNRLGIGTANPYGKMEVKADASITTNTPIFQVVNNTGDTVFAVYPQGVRINVQDDPGKASGSKGGFAVGGFTPSKGTFTNEFLRVTPDSVRIYIEDDQVKASGSKGGFAVGGFTPSKTTPPVNYLDLTPDNYFIGHESGISNETGVYNSFLGYQTGKYNYAGNYNCFMGYQSGYSNLQDNNSFYGYRSGYSNTAGFNNTFMGYNSGYSNVGGTFNTFLGNEAGYSNTSGGYNVFIGHQAGYNNTTKHGQIFIGYKAGTNTVNGDDNTFVGNEAGRMNVAGQDNTYIGSAAGSTAIGNGNVFIGSGAGYFEQGSNKLYLSNNYVDNNNTALIYGEFDNAVLKLNASVGIAKTPTEKLDVNGAIRIGTTTNSNSGTIRFTGSDFEGYTGSQWKSFTSLWVLSGSKIYYNADNVGIGTSNPLYKLHSVDNTTYSDNPAVYGEHAQTDNYGIGVKGVAKWRGVYGETVASTGSLSAVYGNSSSDGTATCYGLFGNAGGTGTGTHYGIYATASGNGTNYAGYFEGNVHVNGTLTKSAGTFRIDHPLDPENKYLSHSFVESPDMKNVYDGVAVMDAQGQAVIVLPDYFEALNKDFRYQLTTIGGFAPVYIEQEINNNQFVIAGGNPGMKVSWQITGIRKDPYAIQHPVIVEEEKPTGQKGKYLNPELYNKTKEDAIFKPSTK